ncbi:hypothetical protein MY11210_009366 [Beauveria gryllotalpidicola]
MFKIQLVFRDIQENERGSDELYLYPAIGISSNSVAAKSGY